MTRTRTLSQARSRRMDRDERRAARHPKGNQPSHIGPGRWRYRGHTSLAETQMREERARLSIVRRKLKAGRPGRLTNAPRPTFDWEKVTNASQKKRKAAL